MHELGYTRSLIDTVLMAAEGAQAKAVTAVHLSIGELRDIVDELFVGCFEHFSQGTTAEGAQVCIRRIPLTVACKRCGFVHKADLHQDETFLCPRCGSNDYGVRTGMEFVIDRIEVV